MQSRSLAELVSNFDFFCQASPAGLFEKGRISRMYPLEFRPIPEMTLQTQGLQPKM
jgi:hypothetical protein